MELAVLRSPELERGSPERSRVEGWIGSCVEWLAEQRIGSPEQMASVMARSPSVFLVRPSGWPQYWPLAERVLVRRAMCAAGGVLVCLAGSPSVRVLARRAKVMAGWVRACWLFSGLGGLHAFETDSCIYFFTLIS